MLRDILEDADGKPREGDILNLLKKKLKRMKVAENRDELFKKGIATNYLDEDTYNVQNAYDNRSRRDKQKPTKFVRSESRPGYLRTASRGTYERENSRYRRASQMRAGSLPGGKFRASGRNNSNAGGRAKTSEKYKSELFKKVESLEKDNKQQVKDVEELKEILK